MSTTEMQPAVEAAPAADRRLSPAAARRWAWAERLMYGAGGVVTAIGPGLGNPWLNCGAVVTGLGTVAWLWGRTKDENHQDLLASCHKALPVLGFSAAYTAALMVHGRSWWEYAVPAGWALLTALWVPLTRSRGLRRALHSVELEPVVEDAESVYEEEPEAPAATYKEHLCRMWAQSPATGDTTLEGVQQHRADLPDFDAVILAPVGQAVPTGINERTVAGVFDVPEGCVQLAQIPGTGPGRLAVRVTPSQAGQLQEQEAGLPGLWAQKVACQGGAAPGMLLVDHEIGADRIKMLVEAEDNRIIHLPRLPLARALGVEDTELMMIESDGLARALVTVYREHPLINIREATAADLTMDAHGMIRIGLAHDGRPLKMALYDPELGALTDLAVAAMGAGKSVFLNTVLAAERISGVVSVVADAQNGMSLPEAKGRTYHFGAGLAAVGATLAAVCALADYREQVSTANGWGGFKLGDPWRLVNTTIDEINLILGEQALVPPEFRKWITGMVSRLQTTGRKFGAGIRFAGQSIHVTDMGDAEKVRANAKQGTVWLGRVNSNMTKSMAADMVTDGTEITPIPMYFGGGDEIQAAWNGTDTPRGPVTAGMAWFLQGGRATKGRVFKAVKENRTFPRLIELYESAPIPGLTPAEDKVFQAAYAEALDAAERFLAGEDLEGGGDDDGEGGGRKRPKKRAMPTLTKASVPPPPATLRDRVLEFLADGMPRHVREIRAAVGVGTPEGPAAESVAKELSKLSTNLLIVSGGHGVWRLPSADTDPTDD